MLEQVLIDRVWAALGVSLALYVAEYLLTVYEARLYHGGVKRFLSFQGYLGSSTLFRFEGGAPPWWNPRYLWVLAALGAGISITWYMLVQRYQLRQAFAFFLGALVFVELAGLVRQLRRVILFHYVRDGSGVRGQVEISRRLRLVLGFNEMYGFTAVFFFSFLLTGSWMLLGGALASLVSSRRQRDYAVMLAEPLVAEPAPEELA